MQTGSKSSVADTWITYIWYLTVRSTGNHATGIDRFSGEYVFNTKKDADIRRWDVLVYNSEDYTVKAVAQFEGISIKYLQALLEKKING